MSEDDDPLTEAEWLNCQDGHLMLWRFPKPPGRRKGLLERRRQERLFACACCRHVWTVLRPDERQLVEVAEGYALGAVKRDALVRALATFQRDSNSPARHAAELQPDCAAFYAAANVRVALLRQRKPEREAFAAEARV